MRIADIGNQDTGGQSYKLTSAIRRYAPEHESRSFLFKDDWLAYPKDVLYQSSWGNRANPKHPAEIKEYWSGVDVIHCHNYLAYIDAWPDAKPGHRVLLHQHGMNGNPATVVRTDAEKGLYRIVSTLNLLPWVGMDIDRWLPAPFDVEWFDAFKAKHYQPHDTIRIIQTATDVGCKRPDVFLAAANAVKSRHPEVEVLLVQRTAWEECQRIKLSCDILFDDFLAYGNTAIEAWLFGIPVVTAPSDADHQIMLDALGGNVPYARATPETLEAVLESFVVSAAKRKEYALNGRAYAEEWHSYPAVVERVLSMYAELFE